MVKKDIKVQFEAAGFRTLGDAKAEKTPQEAVQDAILLGRTFAAMYGGEVLPHDPSRHGANVTMIIPEENLGLLETQSFVGREYPDQTRSTLRVLTPA